MEKNNYNREPEHSKDINEIAEVIMNAFDGEGSDGIERLDLLERNTSEFTNALKMLHSGEGESFESAYASANASYAKLKELIAEMLRTVPSFEFPATIFEIMKSVDKDIIDAVDPSAELFEVYSDEKYWEEIQAELFAAYKYAGISQYCTREDGTAIPVAEYNPEDTYVGVFFQGTQEQYEDSCTYMLEYICEHFDSTVDVVASDAQPNLEDKRSRELIERRQQIKKFALNAGAVAVGSLPAVAAILFTNRRKDK